ncbi:hypothetical protein JI752_001370 [Lysobacter sp. MMG2]|uniref:hypothetical protein n=1 Tax=Lysobacter sp. MMG2 TaxID=2801338 RepID=UPI001C23C4A3|nr:hypothetical protein [Lysobacter sp. MMG2]MBU8974781.1 hypothetical protein [Lysobacter sp. MMG2]
MTRRPPYRIVLHLLLMAFLAVPGLMAPARLLTDAMQAAGSPASAEFVEHSDDPCGAMNASAKQKPCDCCVSRTCDLSACLATGLLPELPRVVAAIPVAVDVGLWRQPPVLTGVIEAPFRPPIA